MQFGPQLLAQKIDRQQPAPLLETPKGPAVAGRRPLHGGADLVDRAAALFADQAAVGPDPGGVAAAGIVEHGAGR